MTQFAHSVLIKSQCSYIIYGSLYPPTAQGRFPDLFVPIDDLKLIVDAMTKQGQGQDSHWEPIEWDRRIFFVILMIQADPRGFYSVQNILGGNVGGHNRLNKNQIWEAVKFHWEGYVMTAHATDAFINRVGFFAAIFPFIFFPSRVDRAFVLTVYII
jgi:hypothetical protein